MKTLPKFGLILLVAMVLPTALRDVTQFLEPFVPAMIVVALLLGVWWIAARRHQRQRG